MKNLYLNLFFIVAILASTTMQLKTLQEEKTGSPSPAELIREIPCKLCQATSYLVLNSVTGFIIHGVIPALNFIGPYVRGDSADLSGTVRNFEWLFRMGLNRKYTDKDYFCGVKLGICKAEWRISDTETWQRRVKERYDSIEAPE